MSAWTNTQRAFFRARWDAGDTYNQIADAMAEKGWPVRDSNCLAVCRHKFGFPPRAMAGRVRVEVSDGGIRENPWTPERVALLRELHGTCTFTEIAARLGGGISRNAAIGKARRIKLPHLPRATVLLHARRAAQTRPACQPAWSEFAPEPRRTPPTPPKPARVSPSDPSVLIAAALLEQAEAAQRRRDQYRSQPNGALRAR